MSTTAPAKTNDQITEEARTLFRERGLEAWKNVTRARVQLWRIGDFGVEKPELVPSGKVIHLTPAERRLNENKVSREEYNPFTNGTFKPLFLLEDDPDFNRLNSNPNVLTDDEIKRIFKMRGEAFRERVEAIDHPAALERLREAAENPTTQALVHQLQMIGSRQATVAANQGAIVESTTPVAAEERRSDTGRALTPS